MTYSQIGGTDDAQKALTVAVSSPEAFAGKDEGGKPWPPSSEPTHPTAGLQRTTPRR
jgi:hypothetical protein